MAKTRPVRPGCLHSHLSTREDIVSCDGIRFAMVGLANCPRSGRPVAPGNDPSSLKTGAREGGSKGLHVRKGETSES